LACPEIRRLEIADFSLIIAALADGAGFLSSSALLFCSSSRLRSLSISTLAGRAHGRAVSLAGCGKRRVYHPEPVSFAGEGSAVRKNAKEKADSSPRSKTERASE
jgi:hypothetical protein